MKNSKGREAGPCITTTGGRGIPDIWGNIDPATVDRADYVLMRRDDGKGPLYFHKTEVEAREKRGWSLLPPDEVERIERDAFERRLGGELD